MIAERTERSHQEKEISPSDLREKIDQFIPKETTPDRIFLINISGASAAGKSTISNELTLGIEGAVVLSLDNYLRGWSIGPLNHDSGDPNKPYFAGLNPEVYDLDQLYNDLVDLKNGKSIERPIFDEISKSPDGAKPFCASNVLIFEGIYALEPPFLELGDVPILIEANLHDRLIRKIVRNSTFYEQEVNDIIHTYLTKDEPTYPYYREELRSKAKFIVNNPLNPRRDFENFSGRREIVCPGDVHVLLPKQENGRLRPEEQLTVARIKENIYLLTYRASGKLLVCDTIDNNAVSLLKQYYDVYSE